MNSEEFAVATWIMITLHQIGKLENMDREMARIGIKIFGLAEIRWLVGRINS